MKVAIGQGVFAKIKDRYGQASANSISYISTGADCWVDVYAEEGMKGYGYEITPLRDVDLSLVSDKSNPSELSLNDNILSGTIHSTTGKAENPDSHDTKPGITPIAIWYLFAGAPRQLTDRGCGYFYDRDPNGVDANGFVVCVSANQHLAHVSVKDLNNRGLNLLADKDATAITQDGVLPGQQPLLVKLPTVKWTGDSLPQYNTHIVGHRRLRGNFYLSLTNDWFSFWSDLYEGFVEAMQSVFESIVEVFAGPPPLTNTTFVTTLSPTTAPVVVPEPPAKIETVDTPKVETVDTPKVETVDAPKVETVDAPKVETVDAPKVETVAAPEDEAPAPILETNPKDLTGIKYVEAGNDLDIALFTEDEFKGSQSIVSQKSAVLVTSPVNSFFLISKVFAETVPAPKLEKKIMEAKKFATKEDELKHKKEKMKNHATKV